MKDRFEMGRAFEHANYLALKKGLQIVICQKKEKSNDYIFMTSKANADTDYLLSWRGRELVNKYGHKIDRDKTNLVARIDEYMAIPGSDRDFWEEIKEEKIFYTWDIEAGPMKYFENTNNMLFWVLRVYKTPFSLKKDVDYKHRTMGKYNMIKSETKEKLKDLYDEGKLEPIIESDDEFYERKKKIKEIIDKHT